MSGDIVIRAEGLSKKYVIGHEAERESYVALRDVITRAAKNAWRKTSDMARGRAIVTGDTTEEFWALKDVNFEVKRGEVLGIIGRNGAGKSTLLKVLSRITEPTDGRITIDGRVASLLEVGTGFHPELTGRENIYLNGAILGMARAEIKRKFDEIVAFAEIDRFLDTPVKRYSSGMYVRLAFAVAAHLEPDILVVDEVLAVGDVEFQKKSMGRMKHVANEGRTVLYVSHNLSAIATLCETGLLMANGRAMPKESIARAIAGYRNQIETPSSGPLDAWPERYGTQQATITSFKISGAESDNGVIPLEETVTFAFDVEFHEPINRPAFGVLVHDGLGEVVLDLRSSNQKAMTGTFLGPKRIEATVPHLGLLPGRYMISIWVNNERETVDLDFVRTCGSFQVIDKYADERKGSLERSRAKFWATSNWAIT